MTGALLQTGYAGPSAPVAERIADAFAALAVAEWLVPGDVDERRKLMAAQFDMLVDAALDGHGRVDAAFDGDGGLAGVAVWFDYTGGPLPAPRDYDRRLAELCGPHLPRFLELDEAFEHHHPDPGTAPHQHLAFCAVDPDRQRKGVGTLLLRQGLDWLDKAGAAGYLEAANLPLTDWYGAYGFESREPLRLRGGPAMYPMWREPRPDRVAA